jgi:hypothetical protein
MNNVNIKDKKNLMKKKSSNANKNHLTSVLCALAFATVFFSSSTDSIFGVANQNDSKNPTIAPNTTSNEKKYCDTHDCKTICNDLRQAFANGDSAKIKAITEKYPGSGDYCGY